MEARRIPIIRRVSLQFEFLPGAVFETRRFISSRVLGTAWRSKKRGSGVGFAFVLLLSDRCLWSLPWCLSCCCLNVLCFVGQPSSAAGSRAGACWVARACSGCYCVSEPPRAIPLFAAGSSVGYCRGGRCFQTLATLARGDGVASDMVVAVGAPGWPKGWRRVRADQGAPGDSEHYAPWQPKAVPVLGTACGPQNGRKGCVTYGCALVRFGLPRGFRGLGGEARSRPLWAGGGEVVLACTGEERKGPSVQPAATKQLGCRPRRGG